MEVQWENDLFYVCSLLEFIARKTNNNINDLMKYFNLKDITYLYETASVNHTLSLEEASDEIIQKNKINNGSFIYKKGPSVWEIGRIYQRLILSLGEKNSILSTLMEVLSDSFLLKLSDYDNLFYTMNPGYIKTCFQRKEMLEY